MEGDVDAFLAEVRSSEKLLQELQDRLRGVTAENEQLRADVAALKKERHALGEESLHNEQELAAVLSKTLLQDVRLKKVLEYKIQAKRDLDAAESELSSVRGQLEEEINQLCSQAGRHLTQFGLNGVYRTEARQQKLNELLKANAQAEQISCGIKDLQQHENILKLELQKLADAEEDIENKRQKLRQPLEGRARVQELQQTFFQLVQDQRGGRHLQQLKADISDAEDETTCLRSAASAMSAELQRLEQLLWFSNMEKMKQRMRATAKCPGQYHCSAAVAYDDDVAGTSSSASVKTGPPKMTKPWAARPGGMTVPTPSDSASSRDSAHVHSAARGVNAGKVDGEYEDLDLPDEWSAPETEISVANSNDPSEGETRGASAAAPAPPVATATAPTASSATSASAAGGCGPSAAELAQRRWGARRALMMSCRQPARPPQPPQPPPPTPPPATPAGPTAPPLASVRPQLRPQSARGQPAAPSPVPGRREWGRAAAPGRLSYRGPQPAKRATDFRTGLQKLREQMSAAATPATPQQKRVRFSTEPPQEELLDCDEMDDFL